MLYKILLILHVLGGTTALASGLISMVVKKSRGLHTRYGRIYYWGMYTSSVLAIIMTILKFNPFLLAIGIFTLYLVYTGKRYIDFWRMRESWSLTVSDKAVIYAGIAVSIFMILQPVWMMINAGRIFVPVLGVFGIILLINSVQDLLFVSRSVNRVPKNKQYLIHHIGKMGGSYIAATTAFLVNNISIGPGWLIWLLPSFIGSFMIAWSIRNWRKKLSI